MFPFVESLRIERGQVCNLEYHQRRMAATMGHFFPEATVPSLADELASRRWPSDRVWKVHVEYDGRGIGMVKADEYHMRTIRKLRLVCCDDIDYEYKSADRSRLLALAAERGRDCHREARSHHRHLLFQHRPLRRAAVGHSPASAAEWYNEAVAARPRAVGGTRHTCLRMAGLSAGEPHQCDDALGTVRGGHSGIEAYENARPTAGTVPCAGPKEMSQPFSGRTFP